MACQKQRNSSNQQTESQLAPKKSSNGGGLFLDPKSAPTLFRSPESVLTVAALGFLSMTGFLLRAAKRFTADVASRSKLLLASRSLRERLHARTRERTFLQSALDATDATLQNTKSYLDVQRERAAIAEDRLQKLQSQQEELRELEKRRELLLKQLQNNQDELLLKEENSTKDRIKLDDARRTISDYRDRLTALDVQCDEATVELADLECAAFDALDLVQQAAEGRQKKLKETVHLIESAREAKYMVDEDSVSVKKKIDRLSESIRSALSQVEEQRHSIDAMSERGKLLKDEIRIKRKGVHVQPRHSVSPMRMKSLLADVQYQHEFVRQSLSDLDERQKQGKEEYDSLQQQLDLRNEQLKLLRSKLNQSENRGKLEKTHSDDERQRQNKTSGEENEILSSTTITSTPERFSTRESAPMSSKVPEAGDLPDYHDPISASLSEETLEHTCTGNIASKSGRNNGSNNKVSEPSAKTKNQSAEKSVGRPPKQTRQKKDTTDSLSTVKRRGRPRKSPSMTETEAPRLDTTQQRKRGRPRKSGTMPSS